MAQKKSFKEDAVLQFISTPAEEPKEENFTVPKGYTLVRESKSERLQLLVRPSVKAAMKKAAAAQGVSLNDLVNQLFDEYLEGQGII